MNDNAKFSAEYIKSGKRLKVALNVFFWKEDSVYFAYSPSLDVTGYGVSEDEAKTSFEITLNEFIKYTANKDTLYEELEHLGWSVNKKKHKMEVPSIDQLLNGNESFREVINSNKYRVEQKELALY